MNKIYFAVPDYDSILTIDIKKRIKDLDHFKNSKYSQLDIAETLKFYTNRYVKQLYNFTQINENTVIADIGTGFGWLPIAFAFSSRAKIIAIDSDEERLFSGREIARILNVEDRIDWQVGRLGNLQIMIKKVDVVYCIEVLEHVFRNKAAIQDICKITSGH